MMATMATEKLHAGQNIRRIRKELGLSLSALAARLGFDKGGLSRIERGERELRESQLAEIAEKLGVSVSRLLEN